MRLGEGKETADQMGPRRTRARHDSQRRIKETGSTCCHNAAARARFLETRDTLCRCGIDPRTWGRTKTSDARVIITLLLQLVAT